MNVKTLIVTVAVVGAALVVVQHYFLQEVERRAAAGARAEVEGLAVNTANSALGAFTSAWNAVTGPLTRDPARR